MPSASLTVVGTSPPRTDAREKVTGWAVFISDLRIPGMVYAKLCRSPLPHARLRGIDSTVAALAPGVLAILTADDFADCDRYSGPAYKDQPILAMERVRYAGEPVVAVVARSEREAEATLALLDVDLEELPAVTTLDEALTPEAPLLHEPPPTGRTFPRFGELTADSWQQYLPPFSLRTGRCRAGFCRGRRGPPLL